MHPTFFISPKEKYTETAIEYVAIYDETEEIHAVISTYVTTLQISEFSIYVLNHHLFHVPPPQSRGQN